ncbi:hypothetical protein [Pantoea sp. paga]|uniref:hypothetical protein n=1 Tax=Pantoea sp. paga TaxID=2597519 RepID=UPI00117E7342|nr:hypothetical protein [Pantoea sp. paga]TSH78702.1 hypothetical protein FOV68_22640 [Pantoea sp. paga]
MLLDRRVMVEKVSGIISNIKEGDAAPFSAFEMVRNIIILGDPGAGKTELLKSRKEIHGGIFAKAANFLNRPYKCENENYYIDALDERRTSTNKRAMTDDITRKLFDVRPDKFRLSSRKQDWLGDADLEVFRDYFDENGGYIVVTLLPLAEEELISVLRTKNIEFPEEFIKQAKAKKLDGLLQNPQNVIMLARAVSGGDWPSTRRDIFTKATQSLLSEHNTDKAISCDANFTAEELRDTAGELCALRLIADLPGYRLHDHGSTEYDGLFYREIRSERQELIRVALQRPVFRGSDEKECLDTVHRTIAEFMAGQWLAYRIDTDLSPARLDALIGREGFPVTALRGLYAWLPVFSRNHSDRYLRADPLGVLTNGDVFSLSVTSKRTLLKSLSDYADRTPWFDTWGEPAEQLKALGIPELKVDILALLESEKVSDDMRMALLRMISTDLARDEDIRKLCRALFLNVDVNYQEAEEALNVLCTDWQNNRQWMIDFIQQEGKTSGRLRLKSRIISLMPEEDFNPHDMANLLINSLTFSELIPLGTFYNLENRLNNKHALEILKLIAASLPNKHSSWRNATQISYSVISMVCILLRDDGSSNEGDLILCLDVIEWFSHSNSYFDDDKERLLNMIKPYKLRILDWACKEVSINSDHKTNFITFANGLHHKSRGLVSYREIISLLANVVDSGSVAGTVRENAYIAALSLAVRGDNVYEKELGILMQIADNDKGLLKLQETTLFTPIGNLNFEVAKQRKKQSEEKQNHIDHLNDICKETALLNNEEMRSDLLHTASRIYWGQSLYVRNLDCPSERLSLIFSPQNIAYIKKEWERLLSSEQYPDFKEVAEVLLNKLSYPNGLCLLTAAEIYFHGKRTFHHLSDNVIRVLLVLELSEQVMSSAKNGKEWRGYAFPWLRWIKDHKITLIADTLISFLSCIELNNPSYHLKQSVVRRLISQEYSAVWIQALKILKKDVENSIDIVCAALKNPDNHAALKKLKCEVIDGGVSLPDEIIDMWNAISFLIGNIEDGEALLRSLSYKTEPAFYLRDMAGLGKYGEQQTVSLLPEQSEKLISALIPSFPEREKIVYDVVITERSRKDDGVQLISRLISVLAADPSANASQCLARLAEAHCKSSYRDDLRQACQSQIKRRRDAEYTQPSWRDVKATLQNQQPANAADLHALLCEHISHAAMEIRHANTDIWKFFWNEGSYGAVDTPRSENSGTDTLITLLTPRLQALNVRLEPEMHMARDKRADIGASFADHLKILIEVKRHYHSEVWTAAENQLQKLYAPDPQSDGYGILLVFWFGEKCKTPMPLHPLKRIRPGTAFEMERWLNDAIAPEVRPRIKCFVLDVSEVSN